MKEVYRFVQHIPPMVQTDTPPATLDFSTQEQLEAWLLTQHYGTKDDFSHYAISGNSLIEVSNNGFYWWVVGYVKPAPPWLPEWKAKYREPCVDKEGYDSSNFKITLAGVDITGYCTGDPIFIDRNKD